MSETNLTKAGGGDSQRTDRPKKESIIDLSKYIDKEVHVKFQGGREAWGKLRGFDQTLNLVLENTIELLRDPEESSNEEDKTRKLGLVVCRGNAITVICPQNGYEIIENPFNSVE